MQHPLHIEIHGLSKPAAKKVRDKIFVAFTQKNIVVTDAADAPTDRNGSVYQFLRIFGMETLDHLRTTAFNLGTVVNMDIEIVEITKRVLANKLVRHI